MVTAGGISRRCRCRAENGSDLGTKCPNLKSRNHGTWQLRHELPAAPDGTRRIFRRSGYALKVAKPADRETAPGAQDDLDRIRELLNLSSEPDDVEAVAALLDSLDRTAPLPGPAEVRRRLSAGQGLGASITVGAWLDQWLPTRTKLRRATRVLYGNHITNYLKPKIGHIKIDRLTVAHLAEIFASIEDDNDDRVANNNDRQALSQQALATRDRAEKRELRAKLATLPAVPAAGRRLVAAADPVHAAEGAGRRDRTASDHLQRGEPLLHRGEDTEADRVDP